MKITHEVKSVVALKYAEAYNKKQEDEAKKVNKSPQLKKLNKELKKLNKELRDIDVMLNKKRNLIYKKQQNTVNAINDFLPNGTSYHLNGEYISRPVKINPSNLISRYNCYATYAIKFNEIIMNLEATEVDKDASKEIAKVIARFI